MNSLVHHGKLPEDATKTADFAIQINDLFDVLNSSTLHAFQHKMPVTLSNIQSKFEFLDKMHSWIASWKFQRISNGKMFNSFPFQRGWLMTIQNMKLVINSCFTHGFQFVSTRHFNQDCLEVNKILMIFANFKL